MYNQAIPTTTITTGIDNKNILEANIRLFNGILKPPFLGRIDNIKNIYSK